MWRLLFVLASLVDARPSPIVGSALFHGGQPLIGRIRGHDTALPPEAVRCVNCHATRRISRALLLEARQRRGGPPTRYDQPAFCKLLRTGIDPGYVLIAREMPIYDVDEAQCAGLWRYLTGKENARGDR